MAMERLHWARGFDKSARASIVRHRLKVVHNHADPTAALYLVI
jgi:hypothetical protein